MKSSVLPIAMVVLSSLTYHLCQKSTPQGLHPIVALIITYVCASLVSIAAFCIFLPKENLVESVKGANWVSYLLGFAVVGLEMGFLLAYRAGWQISAVGLLANSLVALLLIPIGLFLFKEHITLPGITGVALCISGLVLIARQ